MELEEMEIEEMEIDEPAIGLDLGLSWIFPENFMQSIEKSKNYINQLDPKKLHLLVQNILSDIFLENKISITSFKASNNIFKDNIKENMKINNNKMRLFSCINDDDINNIVSNEFIESFMNSLIKTINFEEDNKKLEIVENVFRKYLSSDTFENNKLLYLNVQCTDNQCDCKEQLELCRIENPLYRLYYLCKFENHILTPNIIKK